MITYRLVGNHEWYRMASERFVAILAEVAVLLNVFSALPGYQTPIWQQRSILLSDYQRLPYSRQKEGECQLNARGVSPGFVAMRKSGRLRIHQE